MKVTYYVASSMNGLITENEKSIDWLDKFNDCGVDFKYKDFYGSVDGLIMGRKTYDFIKDYDWPYGDKSTWVCSLSENIVNAKGSNIQPQLSAIDSIEEAKKSGIKHLWVVGGGTLAAHLINRGLVTNLSVLQMPVIIHSGTPLFKGLIENVSLILDSTKTFKEGMIELNYSIINIRN